MKRLFLSITLAVSLAGSIAAQNNWYERYRECINDSSLEYSRQVIEQWEQAEPESPELWNLKTARAHQYICMKYRCLTIHF